MSESSPELKTNILKFNNTKIIELKNCKRQRYTKHKQNYLITKNVNNVNNNTYTKI